MEGFTPTVVDAEEGFAIVFEPGVYFFEFFDFVGTIESPAPADGTLNFKAFDAGAKWRLLREPLTLD